MRRPSSSLLQSLSDGSLILALIFAGSLWLNLSISPIDKQIFHGEGGRCTIMRALFPGRHPSFQSYQAVSVTVQATGFLRAIFPAPSSLLEVRDQRRDRGQPSEESTLRRRRASRWRPDWESTVTERALGEGVRYRDTTAEGWSILNQERTAVARDAD